MKKYICKETITIYDDDRLFNERVIENGELVFLNLFQNNKVLLCDLNGKYFTIGYLVFKDYFEEVKE